MTPEQIIPDFFNALPQEVRFTAVNRFLSLLVTRDIPTLSRAKMEMLVVTIQPIDELSVKALSLLEERLFEIYDITQP